MTSESVTERALKVARAGASKWWESQRRWIAPGQTFSDKSDYREGDMPDAVVAALAAAGLLRDEHEQRLAEAMLAYSAIHDPDGKFARLAFSAGTPPGSDAEKCGIGMASASRSRPESEAVWAAFSALRAARMPQPRWIPRNSMVTSPIPGRGNWVVEDTRKPGRNLGGLDEQEAIAVAKALNAHAERECERLNAQEGK
jgi:hypothetical protein